MSCCPPAPKIEIGGSADGSDYSIADTEMAMGETTECYLRRVGNPTGLHDDATDYVPNKIENNDIPLLGGFNVNVTFRMTPGSTKVPTEWRIVAREEPLPASVKFTSNGATATLVGAFPESTFGKRFKFEVLANATDGEAGTETIDNRGYAFSPAKADKSNEISFVNPLPGSRVNSPFSTSRLHPIERVVKPHKGADFVLKGGGVGDVVAAADGVVEFRGAELPKGAGNYLKIRHETPAGKHLCTTVYMHLAGFYVAQGQKVARGQKIGREGSTGGSTGPHLHFECRLPNGDRVDPVPFIRGGVEQARETNPDNSPKAGSLETNPGGAALTAENVEAKSAACAPSGPSYPGRKPRNGAYDLAASELPPAPPPGSLFDKAWFLTMSNEIIGWSAASLSDPDVLAGKIGTAAQRKKVGFTMDPDDTGGTTKFGIAQNKNKRIDVMTLDYETAKKVGHNNYWKRNGCEDVVGQKKPKTAVMLFDIGYVCGPGGSDEVSSTAGIDKLGDDAACDALAAAWRDRFRRIVAKNPKKGKYLEGWLRRVNRTLAYAKSIKE